VIGCSLTTLNAATLTPIRNFLLQTWTVSFLGLDKGGYCHELFLRGKRFLSQRVSPIQGKKPSSSNKILPNFYMMQFLPESEPKNVCLTNNLPTEAKEPTHHQETYLLPRSQTHLPVCAASTNGQLFSLNNLLHGSPVMPVSYQQRIPGLFEGAMPIPKQRPQLLMSSKFNRNNTQVPSSVPSARMISLGEIVRESRTLLRVQQEDPSHHGVWAQHNPPALQVNHPFASWRSNNH
jgi:hypothetical protein